MIHDDGTPNTGPSLSDADIDALLDQVDAAYEALPIMEQRRLRRSVQQAQQEIAHPKGHPLAPYLDATELFLPKLACDSTSIAATAQAIAAETIAEAKARADAIITAADNKAREVDQIALKTLQDAHREADEIRVRAAAEMDEAHRVAQQARHEAAEVRETARQVLEQAEHDATLLRALAREEADAVRPTRSALHVNAGGKGGKSRFLLALESLSVPRRELPHPPPVRRLCTTDAPETWSQVWSRLDAAYLLEKVDSLHSGINALRSLTLVSKPELASDWDYDLLVASSQSRKHYSAALGVHGRCLILTYSEGMLSKCPGNLHIDGETWTPSPIVRWDADSFMRIVSSSIADDLATDHEVGKVLDPSGEAKPQAVQPLLAELPALPASGPALLIPKLIMDTEGVTETSPVSAVESLWRSIDAKLAAETSPTGTAESFLSFWRGVDAEDLAETS